MNIALWALQILLALAFGMAGIMKVTQPIDKLETRMGGWVQDVGQRGVRLIGTLEILGAIGLILPALTGILPWLTPLAAACLGLTMICAMITHGRRGEFSPMGINLVLLLLTLFVAYGRFVIVPIS
ncbi:MAG TPA: DoxX family protein [Ktedonobacteraceae bacterium]|nr:DoxX family protein [Ktedonobacteraceae bacterium]HYB01232.1 DoxX family protein [Ktedonobacteraceae bacterium]